MPDTPGRRPSPASRWGSLQEQGGWSQDAHKSARPPAGSSPGRTARSRVPPPFPRAPGPGGHPAPSGRSGLGFGPAGGGLRRLGPRAARLHSSILGPAARYRQPCTSCLKAQGRESSSVGRWVGGSAAGGRRGAVRRTGAPATHALAARLAGLPCRTPRIAAAALSPSAPAPADRHLHQPDLPVGAPPGGLPLSSSPLLPSPAPAGQSPPGRCRDKTQAFQGARRLDLRKCLKLRVTTLYIYYSQAAAGASGWKSLVSCLTDSKEKTRTLPPQTELSRTGAGDGNTKYSMGPLGFRPQQLRDTHIYQIPYRLCTHSSRTRFFLCVQVWDCIHFVQF